MKKKLAAAISTVALTFFGAAGVSAENWMFFRQTGQGARIYLDTDSVKTTDGIKRCWLKVVLPDGSYMFSMELIAQEGTHAESRFYGYERNGNLVESWEAKDVKDLKIEPIQPGTYIASLYDYLWGF